MLFLFKKILPQLFISIILEDKKNILRACIYKNQRLISANEKTFDKGENLLQYMKKIHAKFRIYHTALFFNTKEQRLILNERAVNKLNVKCLCLSNALIYTTKEQIQYLSEFFQNYGGLDFLYSPFALLYFSIVKEEANRDKTTLYAYKHEEILTIMIAQGNKILYGDLIFIESQLSLDHDIEDDVKLDEFDEKFDKETIKLEQGDEDEQLSIDQLNEFSDDMKLCRYLINSIEKFYSGEKYLGVFINAIYILSKKELNKSAMDFLRDETFLELKTKKVNTLELMIELMQKELE